MRPLLFSGRQNPELNLDANTCRHVLIALESAAQKGAEPPPLPPLGYGGIEVVIGDRMLRVFDGAIYDAAGNRDDTGRGIEKQLLRIGANHADPEIAAILQSILQTLK